MVALGCHFCCCGDDPLPHPQTIPPALSLQVCTPLSPVTTVVGGVPPPLWCTTHPVVSHLWFVVYCVAPPPPPHTVSSWFPVPLPTLNPPVYHTLPNPTTPPLNYHLGLCRSADDVVAVAKLCASLGVTHVINNAYGVQSAAIMKGKAAVLNTPSLNHALLQTVTRSFPPKFKKSPCSFRRRILMMSGLVIVILIARVQSMSF